MKKLSALLFVCLSAIGAYAESTVLQNAATTSPEQNFWTPQNLWILICSVLITGFIFLIMYALSTATASLAAQVGKKTEQ